MRSAAIGSRRCDPARSLSLVLRELAYAKLNLVLHVGRPREDGLHPICSLMASIDLADELTATPLDSGSDTVICPSVPGDNLAERALADFRSRAGGELPPLELTIDKRIPVAAGLGGGSADAAAALRIANELSGGALDPAGAAEPGRRPRLRRAEPARPSPRAGAGRRRAGWSRLGCRR